VTTTKPIDLKAAHESPFKSDNTASNRCGVTLMNNQVGRVVADVMRGQPNVVVTELPSMIRVDGSGRMDFVYDDISEALGEEALLRRRRVRGEHVHPLRADGAPGRPDHHVRQP